jgi:hypothetical protein
MNVLKNFRQVVTISLLGFGFLAIPLVGWAKNECAVDYKVGSQTNTKSLDAGQTFTFSPAISSLSWVRNAQARPVEVEVTNLAPGAKTSKWVTLPTKNARDPLAGDYSGNVKLFKARCPSFVFPDTQKSPAPGGSVPIPYPNIGNKGK